MTSQHSGEQGYHINYYLTMCVPDALRATLGLQQDGYSYLIPPDANLVPKFASEWEQCQQSLATMLGCGVDSPEVVAVWKVAAAVLHLGQVDFEEARGEMGEPKTDFAESSAATAALVASLLGIDLDSLRNALVTRKIMRQTPPRSSTEAKKARDALARTVYKYLFNVIVGIVNHALNGRDGPACRCASADKAKRQHKRRHRQQGPHLTPPPPPCPPPLLISRPVSSSSGCSISLARKCSKSTALSSCSSTTPTTSCSYSSLTSPS